MVVIKKFVEFLWIFKLNDIEEGGDFGIGVNWWVFDMIVVFDGGCCVCVVFGEDSCKYVLLVRSDS